ncbi:DEAD-box ATP-dependent RNA helicase DeaD (= CshA), partial [hydrothermal vent metagenome]
PMQLPSAKIINQQRIGSFKEKITATLANRKIDLFQDLIQDYHNETGTEPLQIAAALALLAQGEVPLLLSEKESRPAPFDKAYKPRSGGKPQTAKSKATPLKAYPDVEMCRFRLEVGYRDDVKPGNILGAIANEADIDSCYIGSIDIYDDFSTIDLPAGMPADTFDTLKKARVCGKALRISEFSADTSRPAPHKRNTKGKSAAPKPDHKRKTKPKARKKKKPACKASKKSPRSS